MIKEGIGPRVGRIISGSVNALIDAVENAAPAVMMEEAIREIDAAIDEVRSELRNLSANRRMANTRLMQENEKHEDLSDKIALAISDDRDDLAEAAISQQLDIEAQIPVLERAIAEASEREKELEGYLTALQAKKREMRDELQNYLSSREQAITTSVGPETTTNASGASNRVARKAEAAESAFERVLEQQTGLPGSSASSEKKTAPQLAELEELARKNRIQERLAAVKANEKNDQAPSEIDSD